MSFKDIGVFDSTLCGWCGEKLQKQFIRYNGEYICTKCYERRKEQMDSDNWKKSLDLYLTTPPESEDTQLYCEEDECCEPIYPGDEFFVIEGQTLCRECAQKWLEERAQIATENECYKDSEDYGDY